MKKKNVISLKIYLLILLIVIFLASTYAWFTTNKNVRVNTLDVQVATSGNIEISADAVNWKNTIDKKDLIDNVKVNYLNAINQIPSQGLYPTSTTGNINAGRMDMFYGQVITDNETSQYKLVTYKETDTHGVEGKYITFDIFLKVAQETTIHLNPASVIESVGLKNDSKSTGIENAVRMAIINQGNAESPIDAQKLNSVISTTIIEPNYDVHTLSGIENAQKIYNISGLKTTGNEALKYYGVKTEIKDAVALNDTSSAFFEEVNPNVKLRKNFFSGTENVELFKINRGITKLRVYMWIEGQDVDCEDYASGAILKFDLQFTT